MTIGEGEEALAPERLDLPVEIVAGARQSDDIIQIVHRELGHAPLQGCTFVGRQTISLGIEAADDGSGVAQLLQLVADVGGGDDGILALAVVIGLGEGNADGIGAKQQEWCKLLVLIEDARGEAQVAQRGALKEIAAGRTPDIIMPHILAATHGIHVGIGADSGTGGGKVEDNDVGMLLAGKVDAVFVGRGYEQVVAIDKLQILASCHLYAGVAGFAKTKVLLADIDDVVAILL